MPKHCPVTNRFSFRHCPPTVSRREMVVNRCVYVYSGGMQYDTPFQLRLTTEQHEAIKAASERADTSVSRWVRAAIKEKLAREPAGKKPRRNNRHDNA